MIKLLKNRCLTVGGQLNHCADGCCSWRDYETKIFLEGQEIGEDRVSILDFCEMKEGEDYIIVDSN